MTETILPFDDTPDLSLTNNGKAINFEPTKETLITTEHEKKVHKNLVDEIKWYVLDSPLNKTLARIPTESQCLPLDVTTASLPELLTRCYYNTARFSDWMYQRLEHFPRRDQQLLTASIKNQLPMG